MAEPHSPPPEEQAVPGSILDEVPFFSIVDFKHFAVRLQYFVLKWANTSCIHIQPIQGQMHSTLP